MSQERITQPLTLQDLLHRVESATGPDRELDALIMVALGGARRVDECLFYGPGETTWCFSDYEHEYDMPPLPYVTASLDAALALVERCLPGAAGCDWGLRYNGTRARPYLCQVWLIDGSSVTEQAETGALALLTALLRALAAGQGLTEASVNGSNDPGRPVPPHGSGP